MSVEEIPRRAPGPGEVLIKVKYSAICGTDVHAFLYDVPPPGVVMGHEYSGTIAGVGPNVTRWKEGDRVMGGGGTPPRGKELPQRDHPRFDYRSMGASLNSMRSYAEYVINKDWEVIGIPEGGLGHGGRIVRAGRRGRSGRPQVRLEARRLGRGAGGWPDRPVHSAGSQSGGRQEGLRFRALGHQGRGGS